MYLNLEDALREKMPLYTIGDNYIELMSKKCDSDSFKYWITKICVNFGEYNFLDDTTGQNLSFTCFCPKQRIEGNIIINDFYYIEKSAILDVFCIYVKSEVRVKYTGGILAYPSTYIISPISNYNDYFERVIELISNNYSNPLYYKLSVVSAVFPFPISAYKGMEVNYYKALFGYIGDISSIHIQGDQNFNFKI